MHGGAHDLCVEEFSAGESPATLPKVSFRFSARSRCGRSTSTSGVSSASGAVSALQTQSSSAERRPSIAVLPFANMGGDKEHEYFSDVLAEEILNLLAKIKGLKVIARTSSFAFRGKEQDIVKIAETLRVANILEGSVRRRKPHPGDGAAHRRRRRLPSLVGALRPGDGGRIRGAGRSRTGHRGGVEGEAFHNLRAFRTVQAEPARLGSSVEGAALSRLPSCGRPKPFSS
jgi:hypothetical protein